MSKIKLEEIKEELAKDGWLLISTEYKNLDGELIFECNEGHKVYSSWKEIRKKRECPVCKANQFNNIDTRPIKKPDGVIRVLALDQATRISGWAIYDNDIPISFSTFETNLTDEVARYNTIKNWLINMINRWQPDVVAIEDIQFQNIHNDNDYIVNTTTFKMLARLQGVLMDTVYSLGKELLIVHSATWRSYCNIKGRSRADKKKSTQLIMKDLYDITISEDEADALGLGKYASNEAKRNPVIEEW